VLGCMAESPLVIGAIWNQIDRTTARGDCLSYSDTQNNDLSDYVISMLVVPVVLVVEVEILSVTLGIVIHHSSR
jgi:hypothetical protein